MEVILLCRRLKQQCSNKDFLQKADSFSDHESYLTCQRCIYIFRYGTLYVIVN